MSPTKYHKAIAYILSNQYTNKRNLDLWQLIALEEDFVNLLSHVDNDFDEKKFLSLIRRYKPKDFVNHLEQKILSTDKRKASYEDFESRLFFYDKPEDSVSHK
jgi:hypothetical protein|tara:strand:- start:176 stop:484 length:309 start_codon:yes stop_codon:yes gene_type:complete